MMKRYEKRAKCSLNNFQLFLGYAGSLPCLFLWCLLLVSPQFTKNKVFESELKLLRVESWKRVPCPERRVWNGMGEACGGTAGFPGLAAATPSLSLQVVRSVNDKRGWGSRMDAINEQSWLLPPPLSPIEGSLPIKSSTASTFVPMRVIVIQFAGEDWPDCEVVAPGRCEFWLRPGLVSFRGHLGLTGWESVALTRPPLPSACRADCFERSGWRWWLAAGSRAERLEEKTRSSVGEGVLWRSSMF